ncbi:IS3 family transposase [Streptomyces sp. ME18-1-4]|nr:IS3 family transposase [Streptomyces sp. ME18-1-4]MDX3241252.1 IS3 family transposase [Streptomyces sp. ME18-1-4]
MPVIEEIHAESGGTYGARRITRALRRRVSKWPAAPSSG